MLTCKQVSKALAEQDYASLPPLKRTGLRLHVALCVVCGKYNRQVMTMQDTVRQFRSREEARLAQPEGPGLSHDDKEAMKQVLRKNH